MIAISEVIYVHSILIERFGGLRGIRDVRLLESALSRPFQTFDGVELHQGIIPKAASLIESLLNNHPFVDGNKRLGYVIMRLFLLESGMDLFATQSEKYDFVIEIVSNKLSFEGICKWLEIHTMKRKE